MNKLSEFLRERIEKIKFKSLIDYIKNNKRNSIRVLIVLIVIIGISSTFIIKNDTTKNEVITENSQTSNEEYIEEEVQTKIVVDVSGEVNSPMVAELPPGSRVDDAINVAGGLTKEADISNINRASLLEDGQKIFIPSTNTKSPTAGSDDSIAKQSDVANSKVNINTATSEELRTLNGVGPATAEKIIQHREAHGNFKKIEDITKVNGIGEKTLEKFKDEICVN